jgi:FMN-dependent NADH-azoreductase
VRERQLGLPRPGAQRGQHDPVAGAKSADEPLLAGKPTVLVVVRGGAYGPGTPRDGWDHSTAYLRRILADVWGADLTVVEREFTLVGVVPALDGFKDLAAEFKDAAHAAAAAAGKALAAA